VKVQVFQHVSFEDIGLIEKWLYIKKISSLSYTRFYQGEVPPSDLDFDFLILMGGPMGVYDSLQYPWLSTEIDFVARALKEGRKVLGICLGAQVIAASLKAKVYPNKYKEIGWWPIEVLNCPLTVDFPQKLKVFQWHGDTFDLPKGSLRLAKSEACLNQAFFFPPNGLGLQFHLEVGRKEVENLVANCGEDLQLSGTYVQDTESMRAESEENAKILEKYRFSLLDKFWDFR